MSTHVDYDVVIIGAGIQGAGVAQAAAAAGYTTLVIEQFESAGMGTSSKSSKLIHGGLRYLESGQFKLVKECLNERNILLKNAPGLVKLTPFHIPIHNNSKRSAFHIWLGLLIYSLLSLKSFSIIRKKHWTKLKNLRLENLNQVFVYYDAQTDDRKLTRAVIDSAEKLGACMSYSSEFISSYQEQAHHILSYRKDNNVHNVSCKCIINCSGPWVNNVQKRITPNIKLPEIELVAGTHIVIDRPSESGAFYIETLDNRAVFVLPWKNDTTLIGTTERTFHDDPENLQPTSAEISYLIDTYNQYFKPEINRGNVVEKFAGLRVLIDSSSNAFNRSRDSLIVQGEENPEIMSLIGGKLTAYRVSSSQILSKIRQIIPEKTDRYDTKQIKLD